MDVCVCQKALDLLELESWRGTSCGCWNQTQILPKSSKLSYLLNHLTPSLYFQYGVNLVYSGSLFLLHLLPSPLGTAGLSVLAPCNGEPEPEAGGITPHFCIVFLQCPLIYN